ncbi:MAG: type II toxin-antitoxin system HicA family toxin [Prolixibacteraceae bacterium]|nr:type II toxin-antitoxin system HicA family toxin [Prolixibacteraceae bacterium]NLX28522.1 type II toxin-antitoxin system HicA family toxin [Bacteroidales bacterium]
MDYSARNLIRILVHNGFAFRRSNGSHHLYFNAITRKTVTVPVHGSKELPRGTFYAILKQADIKL